MLDLVPRLRPDDVREIEALSGLAPLVPLVEGLRLSDRAWAICTTEGEVAAIMGTQPVFGDPDAGWVWMVGSDLLAQHRHEFLRKSREALPEVFGPYEFLGNLVDARNTLHIRWLRWLGFTFFRTVEYGAQGLPFHEFAQARPTT